MSSRLQRQFLAWAIGLSIYLLLVVVILGSLEASSRFAPPSGCNEPPLLQKKAGRMELFIRGVSSKRDLEGGVLLPVGPEKGLLPGSPEVWREILQAREFAVQAVPSEGFDGQQAVTQLEAFAPGSTVERLLSGQPMKVFRFGSVLYLLTSNKQLQVVDCTIPAQPEIVEALSYSFVRSFDVLDEVAFLLLQHQQAQSPTLIVLDLSDPLRPQEITSYKLPKSVDGIELLGSQLAVYSGRGERKERSFSLYDLTDEFKLSFLGIIESTPLGTGSLGYGKFQFVLAPSRGIEVYDFENPLAPERVAYLYLPDRIKQMAKYGNRLFAWSDVHRLYVIDISSPAAAELLMVVDEAYHPVYLMFVEDYTYYFTRSGSLRVFPRLPSTTLEGGQNLLSTKVKGELVPLADGQGFALIGAAKQLLPEGVKTVLPLRNSQVVVDALQWQQLFVALDATGQLQLFRPSNDAAPELLDTLQLDSEQRWLAAGSNRLYVGGGSSINIVSLAPGCRLRRSGLVELEVASTWDGVVAEDVLSVAAGKAGLLRFPLEDNDQLRVGPTWSIPKQLMAHLDLRQLAATCDGRIFAAAGDAGVLSGKVEADGRFALTGYQDFEEPIRALGVTAGFCLVSTARGVAVIDIRGTGTLQKVGTIELSGVERFVVASPNYWAGLVPGDGWACLPGPRLVLPEENWSGRTVSFALPVWMPGGSYRLNLFNQGGVTPVLGSLSMPYVSKAQTSGSGYVAD